MMKDKRIVGFILLFLLAGTAIGWAAIPQNTIRQNQGLTFPTVNATDGYYVGVNQVITAGLDASFDELNLTGDLINTFNVTQIIQYPEETASYVIWEQGGTYFSKNGTTGTIDFSGIVATTVINDTWVAMPNGGRIFFKGLIDLEANPLVFTLTKNVESIELIGEGETASILQYNGTGFAVTFETDDAAVGFYNVLLQGFTLDGISKTGNRHGLNMSVGRGVSIRNLLVTQFDTGILVNDNTVWIEEIKITACNTGIDADDQNAVRINEVFIFSTVSGVNVSISSSITNSVFEGSGIGVSVGAGGSVSIRDSFFENCDPGVYIDGDSSAFKAFNTEIDNSYFTSNGDFAIEIGYGGNIILRNIRSFNHDNATFYLFRNTNQRLMVENYETRTVGAQVADPLIMDSVAQTTGSARLIGTYQQPEHSGIIVTRGATLAAGDVVRPGGTMVYFQTGGGNQTNVGIVAFNTSTNANTPVFIATEGIIEVTTSGGVATNDILVSSAVAGQAINAPVTDPTIIIGYALEGAGGAGSILTKLQR